ncbi:MAG: serine/threonine-protein phosphatase, partial [Myxococcales bacterium]|nr:serine/threonine-protein phosphatase [Myxococcales bacterium]
GMGGHRGGATASRLAVDAVGEALDADAGRRPADALAEALVLAVRAANARVHAESLRDPTLQGMGTTLVALLARPDGRAAVAHVGDSRAYRLRAGAAAIERVTEDHSVVGELQRRGLLTAEEAETHPRRNEILRSVGVDAEVEVDALELALAPGDRVLLCSAGLCGVISDAEIEVLAARAPASQAVDALVAAANAAGGPDNVTVQIAVAHAASAGMGDAAAIARTDGERALTGAGADAGADPTARASRASAPASVAATVALVALVAALLAFAWALWH